ncbi:DDE superfamily endonuclease-domain-containing protein [Hygrophoropsis aurantiaca]|uniref:DDE superfamily endonuclease-domain-containing protein n=1 Tax=Hygrophoropsis aurantiaca TaxID=72124 RepID=A0ACB7ZQQ0_9AGAM|nr:DDE superfamily endonuclease-domain-containing protein [Hygrophoropsis aurantiaca]
MPRSSRTQADRKRAAQHELENKFTQASKAVSSGEIKCMKKAARTFGVPYHTFHRRHKQLAMPRYKAHQKQQLLTAAQEETVCHWAQFHGLTGHPLSKASLKAKVLELSQILQDRAKRTGVKKGPNKNWLDAFLLRNPSIKLGRPTGLDPKRSTMFNRATVDHHFKLLDDFLRTEGIPWENIYNMDEKGIQLGGGRRCDNTKYLYSRSQKARVKIQNADLELVTIIECVCADGNSLKPGFVFSGVEFCPEWFEEDDILVATSDNGWTSDFIGVEWFEKIFVPQAKARNVSGQPILLIYDGHRSHETIQLRQAAEKHGIHLFCLPPHTTHRLQPLDVGVFGPLQRAWQKQCEEFLEERGEGIQKREVIREYMKARGCSFKETTILQAWKKSGIRPINPNIFTEEDYAPSYETSTISHVPASYPKRLPNAPDDGIDMSSDDPTYDPHDAGDGNETDLESITDIDIEIDGPESSDSESNAGGSNNDNSPDAIITPSITSSNSPAQSTPMVSRSSSHTLTGPPVAGPSSFPGSYNTRMSEREPSISPAMVSHQYVHHKTRSASRSLRSRTSTPAPKSIAEQLAEAQEKIRQLEEENQDLQNLKDAAETHCFFASKMLESTQRKLNAKTTKTGKTTKKLHTTSRILTSEEGRAELRRLEAEKQEKDQQAETARLKKTEEENVRRRRRAEQEMLGNWSGPLKSLKRDELHDLAISLDLSDKGNMSAVRDRIEGHFSSHSHLKTSTRYKKLFETSSRDARGQKRRMVDDDNSRSIAEPSNQRQRLNDSTDASGSTHPISHNAGHIPYPPQPSTPYISTTHPPQYFSPFEYQGLRPASARPMDFGSMGMRNPQVQAEYNNISYQSMYQPPFSGY